MDFPGSKNSILRVPAVPRRLTFVIESRQMLVRFSIAYFNGGLGGGRVRVEMYH